MVVRYSEEDCTDSLKRAFEVLGESPSQRQYMELDIKPSHETISRKFGSWNKAKEKAGLKTHSIDEVGEPPEILDMGIEEWRELSTQSRTYWRKKSKWEKEKMDKGCQKCGYDKHPKALVWHHTNPENKDCNVSKLINDRCSNKRIREEVNKCIVLCSNCHKIIRGHKYNIDQNK